ncbi:MAG: 1-(5-phosphoribosyl)-5-[(5-phosphoribosylamino)methylideneamino]imidazole-4-carboxamide isomerase [Pyrinomonadaceae bacterium]
MMILPAIDLRSGRCVRLTQGRKDSAKAYDGDPVDLAKAFAASGARMLHVVDLDGAFAEPNSKNRQVLRDIIRAVDIPIQFGGGLRSTRDVEQVIELGVTRAVVGTVAAESIEKLQTMVRYARHHLIVGIDAKQGQVVTHGWEKVQTLRAVTLARRVAEIGVERIVYTDVSCDGVLEGPNIEQTCTIARESGLKVTASGGVSSLGDLMQLKAVAECGIDSVIVGKALYEGRFTLEAALTVVGENEINI